MSSNVIKIDLHGVKHEDARRIIIQYIEDNWQKNSDFIIITGHSNKMIKIVRNVAEEYKLHVENGLYPTYQYLRFI